MGDTSNCAVCGASFHPKMKSQKYCSRLCYKRSWSHNHPGANNAKSRKRRLAQPDWYRENERGYYRAYRAKLLSSKPWKYLLLSRRSEARLKELEFDLTDQWAQQRWTGRCEITNIEFRLNGKRGPFPFSPSLDRINNQKGYLQTNCRFILWGCNALKGAGTDADMIEIARAIIAAV